MMKCPKCGEKAVFHYHQPAQEYGRMKRDACDYYGCDNPTCNQYKSSRHEKHFKSEEDHGKQSTLERNSQS